MRPPPVRRRLTLAGAVALPLIALGVVAAGPASAHVVVTSPDAAPGGEGTLVFRVPTETESAKTVKVSVTLPADAPFGDVSVRVHSGWTVATTDRKLARPVTTDDGFTLDKAVATVTWTAANGGTPPGQFDEFALSVGPFPGTAGYKLTFPTTQTYSDGSVVRWDQKQEAGKAEPEHPAPTLTLAGAASGSSAAPAAPSPSAAASTSPSTPPTATLAAAPSAEVTATDDTARYVAVGGLAVAVVALLLGAGAFARARR